MEKRKRKFRRHISTSKCRQPVVLKSKKRYPLFWPLLTTVQTIQFLLDAAGIHDINHRERYLPKIIGTPSCYTVVTCKRHNFQLQRRPGCGYHDLVTLVSRRKSQDEQRGERAKQPWSQEKKNRLHGSSCCSWRQQEKEKAKGVPLATISEIQTENTVAAPTLTPKAKNISVHQGRFLTSKVPSYLSPRPNST